MGASCFWDRPGRGHRTSSARELRRSRRLTPDVRIVRPVRFVRVRLYDLAGPLRGTRPYVHEKSRLPPTPRLRRPGKPAPTNANDSNDSNDPNGSNDPNDPNGSKRSE